MQSCVCMKRQPFKHPDIRGAMLVPLTKGQFAIIDASDAAFVGRTNWHAKLNSQRRTHYAARTFVVGGRSAHEYLHRALWEKWTGKKPFQLDHKNGDGLDNRRENIRSATSSQNIGNTGRNSSNTSGYKGVSWLKSRGKWVAKIGQTRHLGYFDTPEEAHAAYVVAAKARHGEFARVS